jgi:hypothetical protein
VSITGLYLAVPWLVVSGFILWPLAWWSSSKKRHPAVLVSAILIALLCLAPLIPSLESTRTLWRLTLLPFVLCTAIAQLAIRVRVAPVYAYWISWGIGAVTAFVVPNILVAAAIAACTADPNLCSQMP